MNNTRVEVIVLPISGKKVSKEDKQSGIKDLLNIGIW
jgi:hypothetical protein